MFRYFLVLWFITLFCRISTLANDLDLEAEDPSTTLEMPLSDAPTSKDSEVKNDVEELIAKIEILAAHAEKTIKEGILPIDNTELVYSKMQEAVEELVDLTNDTLNIYKFLNAKGIELIVLPNVGIHYAPLKRQILLLVKNLFDVAPVTTNAVIPIGLVDKILEIFEYDDNLALKAHALDIMSAWLPGNPNVQTRIMRMKGLEPFYHQITKLDASAIAQLLDLFNKILKEHIQARQKDAQKSKADHDKLKMYERIGLIERLSMTATCHGMLSILETAWSFSAMDNEISFPIFEVLKNIRPFCINVYKAKPKHTKLFQELLRNVNDPSRNDNLEKFGINITETYIILKEYSSIFNDEVFKDEL